MAVVRFVQTRLLISFLGGKWFVLLDFLVAKHLSNRTLVSLEASVPLVKGYDLYEFKFEARLVFTF
jgi:hypothetical protein